MFLGLRTTLVVVYILSLIVIGFSTTIVVTSYYDASLPISGVHVIVYDSASSHKKICDGMTNDKGVVNLDIRPYSQFLVEAFKDPSRGVADFTKNNNGVPSQIMIQLGYAIDGVTGKRIAVNRYLANGYRF